MIHSDGCSVAGATRLLIVVALAAGCATAPQTRPDRSSLEHRADAVVESMANADPDLAGILAESAGYAVFPEVGEGGLIAGGAAGVGVVYEDGQPAGYAELREGSVGAQAGAQSFAELIVFHTQRALDRFKAGNLDLTANAGATMIVVGSVATASAEGEYSIYVDSERGLMLQAAVAAQSLTFVPRS